RVGDVGMELNAERVAIADCLVRKIIAFGEQLARRRHIEPFLVPLVDAARPFRADPQAGRGRADRIVANLEPTLGMCVDAGPKMARHHLRAETDAEERPLLAQWNTNPVDLALDVVVGVVGAHRTAENHDARVSVHRLWQRIAKSRTTGIEAE